MRTPRSASPHDLGALQGPAQGATPDLTGSQVSENTTCVFPLFNPFRGIYFHDWLQHFVTLHTRDVFALKFKVFTELRKEFQMMPSSMVPVMKKVRERTEMGVSWVWTGGVATVTACVWGSEKVTPSRSVVCTLRVWTGGLEALASFY